MKVCYELTVDTKQVMKEDSLSYKLYGVKHRLQQKTVRLEKEFSLC